MNIPQGVLGAVRAVRDATLYDPKTKKILPMSPIAGMAQTKPGEEMKFLSDPNNQMAIAGMVGPLNATSSIKTIVPQRVVDDLLQKFERNYQAPPVENETTKSVYNYARTNLHDLINKYNEYIGKKLGGNNIVSSDEFKHVLPGFDGSKSADYHEVSSALAKIKKEQLLSSGDMKPVIFMSGGSGSGKTSAIKNTEGFDKFSMVYDSNLNNYESAKKKIDEVLKTGRRVLVTHVNRDPLVAFEEGNVGRLIRAQGSGRRLVPIQAHLDTHKGASETVARLQKEYGNRIDFHFLDNIGGKEDVKFVPFDKMTKFSYNKKQLEPYFNEILKKHLQQGTISPQEYSAYFARTN